MILPKLAREFTLADLQSKLPDILRLLNAADRLNRKTDGDVELGADQRLIVLGDDGLKYTLSVVGGVPTATLVPT